jgi:hypothetical protein
LNYTAAPRYADNEAQNRMDIWVVEQRLRAEQLATDRLTRATKALVWATGVLALATIALVVVNAYSQLSDGHGGIKRSRRPTSWTSKTKATRSALRGVRRGAQRR